MLQISMGRSPRSTVTAGTGGYTRCFHSTAYRDVSINFIDAIMETFSNNIEQQHFENIYLKKVI